MLRYSAHTDVGPRRAYNEDKIVVAEDVGLFAVFDGAGAAAPVDRDVMGATAVVLPEALRRRASRGALDGRDLVDAIGELNAEMFRIAQSHPIAKGSSATMVALLAPPENQVAWIAWVGDCLALELRADRLEPLTAPHTLVREQLAAGVITAEEARASPFKNIITRALGFDEMVPVDVIETTRARRLVLCSDGLVRAWPDDDQAGLALGDLCAHARIDEAARALVDAACARGADDNVTAIVIERDLTPST